MSVPAHLGVRGGVFARGETDSGVRATLPVLGRTLTLFAAEVQRMPSKIALTGAAGIGKRDEESQVSPRDEILV